MEGWPEGYVTPNVAFRGEQHQQGMAERPQAGYELSPGGNEPRLLAERDHPLFGIWIGKVTLIQGYDYTKPAFEPDAAP